MIRVAKSGTRILIADETERGARGYEKFSPGFRKLFDSKREVIFPPIDFVPKEMFEARVFDGTGRGGFIALNFASRDGESDRPTFASALTRLVLFGCSNVTQGIPVRRTFQ